MKKIYLITLGLFALLFIAACNPTQQDINDGASSDNGDVVVNTNPENLDWRNIEIKDVATGDNFKISDFAGKPVLIESFAVWCPTCTKQQKEIKKLHEEVGDSVISISLDTDPNEDEAGILDHITSNGFDWRYAVSPVPLTQSLIKEFGTDIIFAPQAPVILVCEDQSFRKLKNGVKSADKLKSEIEQGCG